MSATKNINAEKIQGILSGITSLSATTISGGSMTITGDTTSDSFSGNTFSGGTFIGDGSQLNLGQPTVAARLYLYNNYY
jgi:hypothetical protein